MSVDSYYSVVVWIYFYLLIYLSLNTLCNFLGEINFFRLKFSFQGLLKSFICRQIWLKFDFTLELFFFYLLKFPWKQQSGLVSVFYQNLCGSVPSEFLSLLSTIKCLVLHYQVLHQMLFCQRYCLIRISRWIYICFSQGSPCYLTSLGP